MSGGEGGGGVRAELYNVKNNILKSKKNLCVLIEAIVVNLCAEELILFYSVEAADSFLLTV